MDFFQRFPLFAIDFSSDSYPACLKNCPDKPAVLYCRGNKELLGKKSIAIVGSRIASQQGKENALLFSRFLSAHNLTIVSGIAKGIDYCAHEAARQEKGGTIAVLGTSIEEKFFYPKENLNLAKKILCDNGLLIGEHKNGEKTFAYDFSKRNRIIAGLSQAVIIIEAKEKSGALITASFAKKYKRPLFALPGDINRTNCRGTNQLIKKNLARLADQPEDIVLFLKIKKNLPVFEESSSPQEEKIKQILKNGPLSIEEIIEQSGLTSEKIATIVSLMEIEGKIKDLGGNFYSWQK
jgi:DNA processing protein